MYFSSKKSIAIIFAWGLAGLFFIVFLICKIHAKIILQTAACFCHKTSGHYLEWLTHLPKLVYRILFEKCEHSSAQRH